MLSGVFAKRICSTICRGAIGPTRILHERAELEAFAEREKQVREARRRSEQRQRAQSNSGNFNRAVDARIDQWALTTYNQAVGQVLAQRHGETRKWVEQKIEEERRAYEARIAELERRLDERQSRTKRFAFARDRGTRASRACRCERRSTTMITPITITVDQGECADGHPKIVSIMLSRKNGDLPERVEAISDQLNSYRTAWIRSNST